ncbi:MotA/TolQ/ExbB proton channel family protein [Chitinispirillum alkaliphilum]|nr:MotA/TolQ/ExbB proton channel family protein [Chitinispirillum alkaliphilum]
MRLKILLLLFFCAQISFASRHNRAEQEELLQTLQELRNTYNAEQNRLQRVTDDRWSQRQRQVDQKTAYQQSADRTLNEIERLYSEIARAREEILMHESRASAVVSQLERERDSYTAIGRTIQSIIERQEDAIRSGFVIGQQQRSHDLQSIALSEGRRAAQVLRRLNLLNTYVNDRLRDQSAIELRKETVALPDNTLDEVTALRFGNVFAVAVNDTGATYYLGYTAQRASQPFEWVKLSDEAASRNIIQHMPRWLNQGRVEGNVYLDVMQNRHSGELLGVERKGFIQAAKDFFLAGGIIMIPLGLICLWALLLLVNRMVVYSLTHSRDDKFIDEAIVFLNQKKMDEAHNLAENSKGVLARILNTCLHHSKWKRPVAEKAVKELLLDEVPALDKHLDTLAVLAAAAPLLGLLGTVTGMISMFESITTFGTGDPQLLAGGISEALVTTKAGLAIAIPILLIHNFLRNRKNHIQSEMEVYAMRILNRLWPEE